MGLLLQNRWIFIVEDNLQNRVVFQMALMRQGAKVEFDRWGDQTIRALRLLPKVDLIILDLMLSHQISGFDVFDKLMAEPAFQSVPILAVSAMEPAVALPQTRQKGFAGFIAKPIDPDLFAGQVARVIGGEKIWSAGERY
jgi:two-component system cell cycle response regulator DivK